MKKAKSRINKDHPLLVASVKLVIKPHPKKWWDDLRKELEQLRRALLKTRDAIDPRTRTKAKKAVDDVMLEIESADEEMLVRRALLLHLRDACSDLNLPLRPLPRNQDDLLRIFEVALEKLRGSRGRHVTTSHPLVAGLTANHCEYPTMEDVPLSKLEEVLQAAGKGVSPASSAERNETARKAARRIRSGRTAKN